MPLPVTETLEHGPSDEDAKPPPTEGVFVRFVDWYVEHPHRALSPVITGLVVALVATVAVDATVVVRHTDTPTPKASPPPSQQVIEERRRAAYRTARFVESQQCDDRDRLDIRVVEHAADWSDVLMEVRVASDSPKAGLLVLDVKPSDIAIAYSVVLATGTCRPS